MSTIVFQRSPAKSAPILLAQGRPVHAELIQWVSVHGDEVDALACRGGVQTMAGSAPGRVAGLASRDELIQWVSVYGDEVTWG